MGGFASVGRSLGDFGSQAGQGYDIAQQWKQRQQQMAFDAAKQKQTEMMAPLLLQELQTRLKGMQQQQSQFGKPQPAGVVQTPGGGRGGVTFDPNTGTYSIQSLIPGAPPEPKFTSLQQAAAYYLQKGDLEKLAAVNNEIDRNKTQKTVEPKDAFELWKQQNPASSVADWLKLQEKYKKTEGSEGGIKTPFELWKQQNPKGTYDQWMSSSKQEGRADATKAVNNAMAAFKNYQSQITNSQRIAGAWSMWKPGTWGSGDVSKSQAQAAQQDFELKRQDAIQKLTDAGMPVPGWLNQSIGGASISPPTAPPPLGFVPDN